MTLLVILLLVLLLGGVSPVWGYSRGWGWTPFGGLLGLVLLVLLVFALAGGPWRL